MNCQRTLKLASGCIELQGLRSHAKASEQYIDVTFSYDDEKPGRWVGSIPIEYRRTGTHATNDAEVDLILNAAFEAMRPSRKAEWLQEQATFWATKPNASTTKPFFDALRDSKWKCQVCELPSNPNWARRTQDLKDFGYTLSTYTNRLCEKCQKKTTHLILVRLPRGHGGSYESWSPKLRDQIIKVLGGYDAFEGKPAHKHLLPDHKFPEIRWKPDTVEDNPDNMSADEIKKKFQLLSNQRNQEKREVCRRCFQTGQRGTPFGVAYFYSGDATWPTDLPRQGKKAQSGCFGCGWYDLRQWRESLNKAIQEKT